MSIRASLVALALLGACKATTPTADEPAALDPGERGGGDWLSDLADDGSLLAGLHSRDGGVRAVAARGLGRLISETAGPSLISAAATETDEDALFEMVFALGQWGDGRAGDVLERLAAHPSARLRSAAVDAIGKLRDDRRTPLVLDALADADPGVRGSAALALFRFDGRRYSHGRSADESLMLQRDNALTTAALHDDHPEVRWRAVYTLAGVRGRTALPTVLKSCLRDDEPLCRLFALRGLAQLERDDLGRVDGAEELLRDPDDRVAAEAVAALGVSGPLSLIAQVATTHPAPLVRRAAAQMIGSRIAEADPDVLLALEKAADDDASAGVRREARASLALCPEPERAREAFLKLARSIDGRDRERAAVLLPRVADASRLPDLLRDDVPAVRCAAFDALGETGFRDELVAGLNSDDPAVLAGAAKAAARRIAAGRAEPDVLRAAADALDRTRGFEMAEARIELLKALSLPEEPPEPPRAPVSGRLLDRLLAEAAEAKADAHPHVVLQTARGEIEIELAREEAPRHVRNLLELAEQGFYDGLDIHRVELNFVVQGLDPRGDGWGVGGRRVPDEVNPLEYITGTVGMPNAGTPHTGGCQIFITHVPTPHLDGRYTVFGQVVAGMDIVQRIEVGDVITSVRRVSAP